MPCYSYVMYRTADKLPADTGYFHASWRQQSVKLGLTDYIALEARARASVWMECDGAPSGTRRVSGR